MHRRLALVSITVIAVVIVIAMYRRSDPRWNRTLQHITENLEHANDTAQENIYGFTQRYIDPCFSSITQCVNACTAPCFPQHNDRRRHRGRARGRAEPSFDFYDDWEDEENDSLLGWGSDNLERFLGASANYGATAQPGRQGAMSYGQRNRDARYNTPRRKSGTLPRDGAQDPTLIPSSSYFGFLGRLPFNIGGKGLRYKPSAADLIEHPGAARRSVDEEQPLIDDSDDDAINGPEHKGHRRQRSDTHTSGHTTDSLSSRGDIFPSEDELEDAVPLDDEFTMALERRTTNQWNEDGTSSNKSRSTKSKRPSASRLSTRTTQRSSPSATTDEIPTLADLHAEEERLRLQEEKEVDRKRQEAHHLAVKRGLAVDSADASPRNKEANHTPSISPSASSPTPMAALQSTLSPLALAPRTNASHDQHHHPDTMPSPSLVDAQTMPDSGAFYVNDSDYGSNVVTPQRPLSLRNEQRDATQSGPQENLGDEEQASGEFVPARLPHFGSGSDHA